MTLNPQDIDALLPQTQCGLCGFNGCYPYAQAIAENKAPINRCPPGGKTGLLKLAALTHVDPAPYLKDLEDLPLMKAVIRENDCIGCTKCISACPVDAVIGSAQHMHTILEKECTGCQLCIPACPVDCIELIEVHETYNPSQARKRFIAREQRLAQNHHQDSLHYEEITLKKTEDPTGERLRVIQEAIHRQSHKKY